MKKFGLLLVMFVIFIFSSNGICAEGPYVGISGGFAMLSDGDWNNPAFGSTSVEIESEGGFGLGAAIGYSFYNNIRVEGEIAYQQNDLDKITVSGLGSAIIVGDTSSLAFLANVYYDFVNNSGLIPFISGGIGFANVSMNDVNYSGSGVSNFNDDDTVFAYQLSVGIGYAISEKTMFDVKYRYFATSDIEIGADEFEYGSHNLYLGLRFNF